MNPQQGYLPTLDGWRAIAVMLVVLFHDGLYRLGPVSDRWFQVNGQHGVDIFFGISGLLICSRLLEEENVHGAISLKGFYIRRALRILPAAYFFLAVIVALHLAGLVPLLLREFVAAACFFRNYTFLSGTAGHIDWYTGHYWSLAVEEHFYLLLPGILFFVPRRWRLPILGTLTLAICVWRLYRQQTRPWEFLQEHTDTRLDALLIPAMFAILLQQDRWRARGSKFARYWFVPAVVLALLITWPRFERVTPLTQSVLIPLMLIGTVLRPAGWFARFLELRILRWVGRISYSLYLWQQLFFTGHFLPDLRPLGFLQSFPMRWIALFVAASASYYFLEKPFMRLGHRLAPPVAPGRPGE